MAASNFNSSDRNAWYFGKLSRQVTQERLQGKIHGTFLVRDSNTCPGDYVLSVSENSKVSHYIINNLTEKLKIGEQEFIDLPQLLEYYKVHYLDTTTLIQTASKEPLGAQRQEESVPDGPTRNGLSGLSGLESNELVCALFEFKSDDKEDLPFTKGEILVIVSKPEENWWMARNSQGKTGQIPVPYVKPHVPSAGNRQSMPAYQQLGKLPISQINRLSMPMPTDRSKSVYAKAKMKRVPSAYDPSALALEIGDVVLVTNRSNNGKWEGRIGNRTGTFPFTHVEIIEENH